MLNQPLDKFWITLVKTLSSEWSVTTLIHHYMLTTCKLIITLTDAKSGL
jgi:hypothetical protein